MNPSTLRMLLRPGWLLIILLSVAGASLIALLLGLQQETRYTATTNVFGQRVGYIDRPNPVLEDHMNDLVNAVEFPDVFFAIEDRTRLKADDDYEFEIARVEDAETVVAIDIRAQRAGDAERIARIFAEEVVNFVLRGQLETLNEEVVDFDAAIAELSLDQIRLKREAGFLSPVIARNRTENLLLGMNADEDGIVGNLEGDLRNELANYQPLANNFVRNRIQLDALYVDRARTIATRSDVAASLEGVNDDWYRTITPVEPASNVPVAIAMAFAAGVPALVVSVGLIAWRISWAISQTAVQSTPTRRRIATAA